jgi:hypothetical protein
VQTTIEGDLALMTDDAARLQALQRALLTTATPPEAPTLDRWPTGPGLGTIRRRGRRSARPDLRRVPSVQDVAAAARLVHGRTESAGQRAGPAGHTLGKTHLQGALSAAAVLVLRHQEPGPTLLARGGNQPDQGNALRRRAPHLGRVVSDRLPRHGAVDRDLVRQASGRRAREPDASLDVTGMSRTCACRGSDGSLSVHAKGGLGPVSLSPAPLMGPALGLWPRRCRSSQVTCAAPPPRPARTGEAHPLTQAVDEDGLRARHDCEGAEAHRHAALPSSPP